MHGGGFRVPGAEILPANSDARELAAEVDGSGPPVALYVGADVANARKRVQLTGDTPDEPVVHVYTASTTWTKATDPVSGHPSWSPGGGGTGGGVAPNARNAGGAGGTATGGDVDARGGGGGMGAVIGSQRVPNGFGGTCGVFGGPQAANDAGGIAGAGWGTGGSGASSAPNISSRTGGPGAKGACVITEYY